METNLDPNKAQTITKKINFTGAPSKGFSGEIWLLWKYTTKPKNDL